MDFGSANLAVIDTFDSPMYPLPLAVPNSAPRILPSLMSLLLFAQSTLLLVRKVDFRDFGCNGRRILLSGIVRRG